MARWVKNPDSGGEKIPEIVQKRVKERILKYAEAHYQGKYSRLDIRFRGQFCYIDAYTDDDIPTHLCRLRYFGDELAWSFCFYTYSDEKYRLCLFNNGTFYGTPEEAFAQSAAVYLGF